MAKGVNEREILKTFDEVKSLYNVKLGIDLSYMKCKISDMPEHTDGSAAPEYVGKSAGCRTSKGYIVINPDLEKPMKYYGSTAKNINEFLFKIIAHELGHEVYAKHNNATVQRYIDEAMRMDFDTEYLNHEKYTKVKYQEELFCEFMGYYLYKNESDYEYDKFYFYNAVSSINEKGLITPGYAYRNGDKELFRYMTNKYRYRICYEWNIFPNKTPDELTDEDIVYALNKFRKSEHGIDTIYFFRYKPSLSLGPNIRKSLNGSTFVRINLNSKKLLSQLQEDVFWGYDMSSSNNKPLNRIYYEMVSKKDYFSRYDDNNKMIYSTLNHIGLIVKNGQIKPSLLEVL